VRKGQFEYGWNLVSIMGKRGFRVKKVLLRKKRDTQSGTGTEFFGGQGQTATMSRTKSIFRSRLGAKVDRESPAIVGSDSS